MLLLHGPQTFFLRLCLLHHVCLLDLECALVHNLACLLFVEALHVVRLDTVISEHRLLSSWVLRHEVVGQGVLQFVLLLHQLV